MAARFGSVSLSPRALQEMARCSTVSGEETPFTRARLRARGPMCSSAWTTPRSTALVAEGRLTELTGVGPGLAAAHHRASPARGARPCAGRSCASRLPPARGSSAASPRLGLAQDRRAHAGRSASNLGRRPPRGVRSGPRRGGEGDRREDGSAASWKPIRRPRRSGPRRAVLLSDALDAAESPCSTTFAARPASPPPSCAGDLRRRHRDRRVGCRWFVASTAPAAARDTRAGPRPASSPSATRGPDAYRARCSTAGCALEVRVSSRPSATRAELLHATGAPAHVAHLRRLAEARGLAPRTSGLSARPGAAPTSTGRGRDLPPPRPAVRSARASRGRGRDRGRGGRPSAAGPRAHGRRPGARPLPHRVLRRPQHGGGDGARRGGARHALPHHHRPLAHRVLRGRPRVDRLARAVGRDRARAGEGVGAAPAGHRVATSSPTARWTIPTRCSSGSTS